MPKPWTPLMLVMPLAANVVTVLTLIAIIDGAIYFFFIAVSFLEFIVLFIVPDACMTTIARGDARLVAFFVVDVQVINA